MSTESTTSLNPRLQSILVGVQGRMAERQNTTQADDAPPSPQLQSILARVQSRMSERQTAIQAGDTVAKQQADQAVLRGLHDAADACPHSPPEAKQGF
ncbi:hypothetical protein FS749_002565 [Ceratobasidium sp. UAMH 11750]|nr:hypothetical protein FS749_002565 [Ceratobasidium sp. UAMH 11750]